MFSSMFSPIDRALALAERYVHATERIACAHEAARRDGARLSEGWDRIVLAVEHMANCRSDETMIDMTALNEAINGLRETLAKTLARISDSESEVPK